MCSRYNAALVLGELALALALALEYTSTMRFSLCSSLLFFEDCFSYSCALQATFKYIGELA